MMLYLSSGSERVLGRQLRLLAFQRLQIQAHHGDFDGLRVNVHTVKVVPQYAGLADDRKARLTVLAP